MAAPFEPPSTAGKPQVPKWIPPEATKEDLDWASLHTIDLSLLDSSDSKVVADLVQLTKTAIKEDGFLYLTNHGISLAQLHRQFALAQYTHRCISDGDKARLLWDPASGVFAGWKRKLGWKREAGEFDGIEQFNFYRGEFEDVEGRVPECLWPFMDEITAFSDVGFAPEFRKGRSLMRKDDSTSLTRSTVGSSACCLLSSSFRQTTCGRTSNPMTAP